MEQEFKRAWVFDSMCSKSSNECSSSASEYILSFVLPCSDSGNLLNTILRSIQRNNLWTLMWVWLQKVTGWSNTNLFVNSFKWENFNLFRSATEMPMYQFGAKDSNSNSSTFSNGIIVITSENEGGISGNSFFAWRYWVKNSLISKNPLLFFAKHT